MDYARQVETWVGGPNWSDQSWNCLHLISWGIAIVQLNHAHKSVPLPINELPGFDFKLMSLSLEIENF